MTGFHLFRWLDYTVDALFVSYALFRFYQSRRKRPAINKADITYQEWFASGHSEANFITKLGGARNCIRLVVTQDILWITLWFPFSLFGGVYDLEHVILLDAITDIKQKRYLFTGGLQLTYRDGESRERSFFLVPKDRVRFIRAIRGQTF